ITDLAVTALAPDVAPLLASPASEVRATAARCEGRLHDPAVASALRGLLEDPVQDVREAAQFALAALSGAPAPARPRRDAAGGWTSEGEGAVPVTGWQAALLARLQSPPEPGAPSDAGDDVPGEDR
ncbi:MAG TPA: HEAT repeat domain-containing protein, partial [Steroidobacteraceae bacterium]|nr:HEAT repeat domain-containing protein [Steroidobacteraceae bacterium]